MLSHTLDGLYILTCNPYSLEYQKMMTELHNAELQRLSYQKTIYNIITLIITGVLLEKELLVQEQLKISKETAEKYLTAIVLQEAEKQKAKIEAEANNFDLKNLIDYLLTQNNVLIKEKSVLEIKLVNLSAAQKAIQEANTDHQKEAGTRFENELKERNISTIYSVGGEEIKLDDAKIAKLRNAAFSRPDPVRLVEIVPNLVRVEENEIVPQAKVMNYHADAMSHIKLLGTVAELAEDLDALEARTNKYGGAALLKILQKNPKLFEVFTAVVSEPEKRQEAIKILGDALKTNKPYLTAQMNIRDMQIKVNEERISVAKAEMARPRPSPFSHR